VERIMTDYDIYFFCTDYNITHPMGIKFPLKNGPQRKTSVGAFFAGQELPPKVAKLINGHVLCPKTGKMFAQRDLNQIFLVLLEHKQSQDQ
jgi:hypothetical protein